MASPNFNIGLYYRFTRTDRSVSVLCRRGDAAPVQTAFGGRWNKVDRPRQRSFIMWEGDNVHEMDVPILFDGWDTLSSVEDEIGILSQMRTSGQDYSPPPIITIEGALPVKSARWVITGIDWGDNVIWHEGGFRVRQDGVVHLLQHVVPDQLDIKPPATTHVHIVKSGETLKSISRDEYGTPKYWSALKKANNIRDIKKLPKRLRIPPVVNPGG